MEFTNLINNAIEIIEKEMCIEENTIFLERYVKMKNYLQRLQEAYNLNKLNTNSIYLNVVRMLDHGDSEKLQCAISELNHFYQEKIYQEK